MLRTLFVRFLVLKHLGGDKVLDTHGMKIKLEVGKARTTTFNYSAEKKRNALNCSRAFPLSPV